MRAIVTGAGGFIGRALVSHLRAIGWNITTIGTRHMHGDHVHLDDITNVEEIRTVLVRNRPEVIFHLAGLTKTDVCAEMFRVNTLYANAILEAIRRSGVCTQAIVFGSAAEYGVAGDGDCVSESVREAPNTLYGIAKLAQTHLTLAFARSGFNAVVCRPFNVVGKGMASHLALGSWASQLRDACGERIRLHVGSLEQERDFIHVSDVVECVTRLVGVKVSGGVVVNVCSGRCIKMQDMLDRLIKVSGREVEVIVDPALVRPVDVLRSCGCPVRVAELTGWHASQLNDSFFSELLLPA